MISNFEVITAFLLACTHVVALHSPILCFWCKSALEDICFTKVPCILMQMKCHVYFYLQIWQEVE